MMENLISEGMPLQMMIVSPNNQVIHRRNPKYAGLTCKLFGAELRQQIMPSAW